MLCDIIIGNNTFLHLFFWKKKVKKKMEKKKIFFFFFVRVDSKKREKKRRKRRKRKKNFLEERERRTIKYNPFHQFISIQNILMSNTCVGGWCIWHWITVNTTHDTKNGPINYIRKEKKLFLKKNYFKKSKV